jgi:hypothetical protein
MWRRPGADYFLGTEIEPSTKTIIGAASHQEAARCLREQCLGETEMSESNLSSCVSRRTVLIAAAGAAPLLALSATGAIAAKMSQSAVRYQATPKDGKQCSDCKLFVAPNACKNVEGDIAPAGWCALWVKKA